MRSNPRVETTARWMAGRVRAPLRDSVLRVHPDGTRRRRLTQAPGHRRPSFGGRGRLSVPEWVCPQSNKGTGRWCSVHTLTAHRGHVPVGSRALPGGLHPRKLARRVGARFGRLQAVRSMRLLLRAPATMNSRLFRRLPLIATIPVALAACAPQEPDLEETRVMGQMLRGGQSDAGDSFLSFDVLLTEANNGPTISCEEGTLEVTIEVSTDRGRSFEPVSAQAMNVVCEGSVGPDVALVVDNSGSQEGQLEAIQDATSRLAADIIEMGGRASITRVSTESSVMTPLTDDFASLERAIGDFSVTNGWTALYDGVRLGNETLGRAEAAEDGAAFETADEFCGIAPRRAVVAFTDGRENNSSDEHATSSYPGDGIDTLFNDVKQLKVRGTKTPVYTIGLGNDVDHQELNRLGNQSGGKHHAVESLDELAETFANVRGYTDKRFRVCGELPSNHCGRLDVRMSYTWSDGSRTLDGHEETRITVPCAEGTNSDTTAGPLPGRAATVLLTLSNPAIEQPKAEDLILSTVQYVGRDSATNVLVVLDDSHHGENPEDARYVADILDANGIDVSYIDEPEDGVEPDDLAGYDVIWFSNPGYPMDDELSFATLQSAMAAGAGVVLQGDDMTFSYGHSFDMSPLTRLVHQDNGVRRCGVTTDNNSGDGNYDVTYEDDTLLGDLAGSAHLYGDDIDISTPLGTGEQVLAAATAVDANGQPACSGSTTAETPVVVFYDPAGG